MQKSGEFTHANAREPYGGKGGKIRWMAVQSRGRLRSVAAFRLTAVVMTSNVFAPLWDCSRRQKRGQPADV